LKYKIASSLLFNYLDPKYLDIYISTIFYKNYLSKILYLDISIITLYGFLEQVNHVLKRD